ncbi:MAG TPA: histidine kinase [Terriglobales bacterium]|nr:histidine kinase [Terriglobales bacterium]
MAEYPQHLPSPARILRSYALSLGIAALAGAASFLGTYLFRAVTEWTPDLTYIAISTLISFLIYGLLAPIVVWLAMKFPVERKNWIRRILLHLVFAVMFTAVHVAVRPMVYQMRGPDGKPRTITWRLYRNLFIYLAFDNMVNTYMPIALLGHFLLYQRRLRDREVRSSQLQAKLAQAQLAMLKMQLQPHFLFNTLNAVSALIRDNPHAAEETLARLSELLRLTLDNEPEQEISLKVELDFIQRYLEIEQIRFEDRLHVSFDIEPSALDGKVPNMLLQPLVENALRHGIAKRAQAGKLQIRAWREQEWLMVAVHDNGPGIPEGTLPERIGLANTRSRLRQLYGDTQRFTLESSGEGGTIATVQIPFHPAEHDAVVADDHWFAMPSETVH